MNYGYFKVYEGIWGISRDGTSFGKKDHFSESVAGKLWAIEEQIMDGQISSIFLPQMETVVFQWSFKYAMRAVLKIGGYSRISQSFSWWIFGHMMCLDQSCAGEKIWWIIRDIMLAEMAQWEEGSPLTSVICEFVVGSHFLRRVFLRVLRFPSRLKKPTFPNSNLNWLSLLISLLTSVYHYSAFIS